MLGRNDLCWCASGKKWKKCHFPLKGPSDSKPLFTPEQKKDYLRKYGIYLKERQDIEKITAACELASEILEATCALVKPGVTTQELNDFAHELHIKAGAIPAPLHYGSPPFPKSICISLNEVICHGIPDQTVLKEGDILNIDVTPILDGYYGDCSKMVAVGKVSPQRQLLMDVSYECLIRSIAILRPGLPISAIGDVIESYATAHNCSVVNQFVGHGVGIEFHEGPQIPHNKNKSSILLVPGMTLTVEPMINLGVREAVIDPRDHWTARTKDGKESAQWEHTILITAEGHKVLTSWTR